MAAVCQASGDYSHVVNGRFKGGYITRHYGRPEQHVHAIQLEKCRDIYMVEGPPFAYDPAVAAPLQPQLRAMVQAALDACKALYA